VTGLTRFNQQLVVTGMALVHASGPNATLFDAAPPSAIEDQADADAHVAIDVEVADQYEVRYHIEQRDIEMHIEVETSDDGETWHLQSAVNRSSRIECHVPQQQQQQQVDVLGRCSDVLLLLEASLRASSYRVSVAVVSPFADLATVHFTVCSVAFHITPQSKSAAWSLVFTSSYFARLCFALWLSEACSSKWSTPLTHCSSCGCAFCSCC
jgi:hypothetical protein